MYGPSENTIETTIGLVTKPNDISIGKAIDNVELFVLDEQLNQVPLTAYGELYIAGLNLSNGYLGEPSLTKDRFVEIPKNIPSSYNRMYKTGDIVKYDVNGNLFYFGRNDKQVKVRGFRIELDEIDGKLLEHPLIKESKTVVKNDTLWSCVIFQNKLETISYEGLMNFLKEDLPSYMVPSKVYVRENLPLSFNKKIDKKKLFTNGAELATFKHKDNNIQQDFVEENVMVSQVKNVWEKLLGRKMYSTTTSFFDEGGNSLLLIELKEELNKIATAKQIRTTDLFKYISIKDQSDWLKPKSANIKMVDNQIELVTFESISEAPEFGYQVSFIKN